MADSAKKESKKKKKKAATAAATAAEPVVDKPVVDTAEDETPADKGTVPSPAEAVSIIKKLEKKKRRKLQKQLDLANSASALALQQHANKKDPLQLEIDKELAKSQTVIPKIEVAIMTLVPSPCGAQYARVVLL